MFARKKIWDYSFAIATIHLEAWKASYSPVPTALEG